VLQRGEERRFFPGRDFYPQDTREFSAQPAHPALEPVAAVIGHNAGHGLDQPGAVRADNGHYQGNLHGQSQKAESETGT